MSIPVVISGTTFQLPTQGVNPPWGTDLTAIIQALVTVANTTSGANDISTTSFTVANNQVASSNITGLAFDTSQVRSAIISYSIYRSTTSNELSEVGQLYITYSSVAQSWELVRTAAGNSGMEFTITNSGQMQFTSSSLSGSSYSALLTFNAKTFLQT